MPLPYRVGLRRYKVIGAVCCVFFVGCGIGAFLAKQYWPILVFMFFALMGIYILVCVGSYELSETEISHTNLFGRFRMRWRDVREAEFGTQGSIVLHGRDMRFVVAPPSAWSGEQKAAAIDLLCEKLDVPEIKSHSSNLADYKTHKNVRD